MNDIPVYTEESERLDWQRVQCGPQISNAMFVIEYKIVILCVCVCVFKLGCNQLTPHSILTDQPSFMTHLCTELVF